MFNKGNMTGMLKQAREIQKKIEHVQSELEEKELLEDLIISAVNKVLSKSQEESQNRMNAVTGNMLGGMKIPGM